MCPFHTHFLWLTAPDLALLNFISPFPLPLILPFFPGMGDGSHSLEHSFLGFWLTASTFWDPRFSEPKPWEARCAIAVTLAHTVRTHTPQLCSLVHFFCFVFKAAINFSPWVLLFKLFSSIFTPIRYVCERVPLGAFWAVCCVTVLGFILCVRTEFGAASWEQFDGVSVLSTWVPFIFLVILWVMLCRNPMFSRAVPWVILST